MTPFIGVRISWLMLARKPLFALFASVAMRVAFSSSAVLSCTACSSVKACALSFSHSRALSIRMVACCTISLQTRSTSLQNTLADVQLSKYTSLWRPRCTEGMHSTDLTPCSAMNGSRLKVASLEASARMIGF
jgi:hypothetical protein